MANKQSLFLCSYGESTKSESEIPKTVQESARTKLETRVRREEIYLRKSSDSSAPPKRVTRSSAGSVQSFDNSPVHPRQHARGGNRGSVSSESSYGAGSSTPGRTRLGQKQSYHINTSASPLMMSLTIE